MLHMDSPTVQLQDRVGDRNVEKARETGQIDEVGRRAAFATVSANRRDASPDLLDPFDLDDKVSRRNACHTLWP